MIIYKFHILQILDSVLPLSSLSPNWSILRPPFQMYRMVLWFYCNNKCKSFPF